MSSPSGAPGPFQYSPLPVPPPSAASPTPVRPPPQPSPFALGARLMSYDVTVGDKIVTDSQLDELKSQHWSICFQDSVTWKRRVFTRFIMERHAPGGFFSKKTTEGKVCFLYDTVETTRRHTESLRVLDYDPTTAASRREFFERQERKVKYLDHTYVVLYMPIVEDWMYMFAPNNNLDEIQVGGFAGERLAPTNYIEVESALKEALTGYRSGSLGSAAGEQPIPLDPSALPLHARPAIYE